MSEIHEQMERWLKAQQEHWQQLLAQGAETTARPDDWSSLLNKQGIDDLPESMVEMLQRLSSQADQFTRYGESLLQQAAQNQPLNQALDQFVSYIQQQQTDLMLRRWQLPEHMLALFKSHSFRDDLFGNDPFTAAIKPLLETGLPGLTHHQRAQFLEGNQLFTDYQQALRDYMQQYNQIMLDARDRLRDTIENSHPLISSLAELHESWTNCYESAYSDTAFTDNYQRAYGRVSNALMRLQQFWQQWRDEQYEAAGLISQQLFDRVLERQQQMRKQLRAQQRENQRLQQQITELQAVPWQAALEQMRSEIDNLRAQLDDKPNKGSKA